MNEDDPSVDELLKLAEEYCALLDSIRDIEIEIFLPRLAASLSQLYAIAIQLPYVEPATDEVPGSMPRKQDWGVWNTLRQKLGPLESYYTVYEPRELSDPVQGSLANDLFEIYEDLKEDIALVKGGAHPSDIAWSWRESFREHWGNHATDALRAIYWRVCR